MPHSSKPAAGPRKCHGCRRTLDPHRQSNARYHSDACRAAANRARKAAATDAIAALPAAAPETPAPPAVLPTEIPSVLARLQAHRERAGLPPLELDPGLGLQAQAEALRLATQAADQQLAGRGDPPHADVQLLADLVPQEGLGDLEVDQPGAEITRCGVAVLPAWAGGPLAVAVVLQ